MWCASCQQDVPGVAAAADKADKKTDGQTVCCARCGTPLVPFQAQATRTPTAVPFEDLPDFVELADWELAETIEQAERLVHSIASDLGQPSDGPPRSGRRVRWDRAHQSCRPGSRPEMLSGTPAQPAATRGAGQSAPWLVLTMGLAVFVCGAALIAMALVSSQPQLWQLGLPMVLGGQVAVLAVVVSQLDAVWNSNRATFVALHAMDDQLRQMREQWADMQELHEEPAFYRHLAQGASPEVLLSDLKDQIDVLSKHLAQQQRAA